MSRKKLSTTVYITPDQDAALKALSHVTHVPVAEYIRKGIDLLLKEKAIPEAFTWPPLFVGGRGS